MNVYNITFSEGNMLGQQSGAISKPEGLAKWNPWQWQKLMITFLTQLAACERVKC